jgi:hypothetical protein
MNGHELVATESNANGERYISDDELLEKLKYVRPRN